MSRRRSTGLVVAIATAALLSETAHAQIGPRVEEPAPVPAPPPAPPDPGGVRVDISADSPNVRLVRVDGAAETVICAPPCGVVVPREGRYQLAGDGVTRTNVFAVPDHGADLQLSVRAGSNFQRRAGIVLGLVGWASFAAGEGFTNYEDNPNNRSRTIRDKAIAFGLFGAGIATSMVGLLLIFTARTHVTTSTGVWFSHASPRGRRTAIRLTPAGLEF